jgi:hypothetical protein
VHPRSADTITRKILGAMSEEPSAQPFVKIMNSVAARMGADLEASRAMAHAGGTGAARERILHSFIESYLPQNLRVYGSAEVISASGGRSGQCDIVVVDHKVPPLLDLQNHRILACEGVYIVIEVKSSLTKLNLVSACRTIAKVKRLKKVAKETSDPAPYADTVGIVLAFAGPRLQKIATNLSTLAKEHGADNLPDSIYVLGKGFFDIESSDGRLFLRTFERTENDIALALMTRLNAHYNKARMPLLNLDFYAGEAPVGRYIGSWPLSGGPLRPN